MIIAIPSKINNTPTTINRMFKIFRKEDETLGFAYWVFILEVLVSVTEFVISSSIALFSIVLFSGEVLRFILISVAFTDIDSISSIKKNITKIFEIDFDICIPPSKYLDMNNHTQKIKKSL